VVVKTAKWYGTNTKESNGQTKHCTSTRHTRTRTRKDVGTDTPQQAASQIAKAKSSVTHQKSAGAHTLKAATRPEAEKRSGGTNPSWEPRLNVIF